MRPHHNRTSIQHWCSSVLWSELSLYLVLWSVKVQRTCQPPRASNSNGSCSCGLVVRSLDTRLLKGQSRLRPDISIVSSWCSWFTYLCNGTSAAGSAYLARKAHQDADDCLLSHSGHGSSKVIESSDPRERLPIRFPSVRFYIGGQFSSSAQLVRQLLTHAQLVWRSECTSWSASSLFLTPRSFARAACRHHDASRRQSDGCIFRPG